MDVLILKALGNRQRFKSLRAAVPVGMITPDTSAMLAWYEVYWTAFPEQDNIKVDDLISLVRLRSGDSNPNGVGLMVHLCEQLRIPIDADSLKGIVGQLHELDLSGRAGNLISRYNNGEEVQLAYELQMLAAQAKRAMSDGSQPNWAYKRIHEYLLEDSDEGGLQWNMFPQLQHAIKGLRAGDNVAIAAPTDQGKSSLMCKIAVGFQEQAKVLFPNRPFLYLVNEQQNCLMLTLSPIKTGYNKIHTIICLCTGFGGSHFYHRQSLYTHISSEHQRVLSYFH